MDESIKRIKEKIKTYSLNQIEITDYCREKMNERNIDENLLITTLSLTNYIMLKSREHYLKDNQKSDGN